MDTLLDDQEQFPTDEIIFPLIGASKAQWVILFEYLQNHYPEFVSEWRYYKDGKRWLMKTVRKSKTIFWLSLVPNGFKITFYFGDKAEPAIMESSILESTKSAFLDEKRIGKIRAITLEMDSDQALKQVQSLIKIKLSQK